MSREAAGSEDQWAGDVVVAGLAGFTVAPMGYLHAAGSTTVDPVAQPLSDYVMVSGGYALVGVSTLALAGSAFVLAAGLARAELPRPRSAAALLVLFGAALVLVALFPTTAPGVPLDLSATVHRYAGAVAVAALPLAGVLVAARARGVPGWDASAVALRRWSLLVAGIGAFLLVISLPDVILGADPSPVMGAVQRVLYGVVIVALVGMARATRTAHDHGRVVLPRGIGDAASDPGRPA